MNLLPLLTMLLPFAVLLALVLAGLRWRRPPFPGRQGGSATGSWSWEYAAGEGVLSCPELMSHLGERVNARYSLAAFVQHFVHRDDRRMALDHLAQGEVIIDVVVRVKFAGSGFRWLHWQGCIGADGRQAIHGTCRDITCQRALEIQDRVAMEVIDSVSDAVALLDARLRVIRTNRGFLDITGYSGEEAAGQPISVVFPDADGNLLRREIKPALAGRGSWQGEHRKLRRDGSSYLAKTRIAAVVDERGRIDHYVCVFTDVTGQRKSEERLHFLANFDAVTGLLNRAALVARLERAIAAADSRDVRIAVLYLGLDNFRQVNDSFGHASGDNVLRAAARRISAMLRAEDVVARIAGDEFVVVLDNMRTRDDVVMVAAKLGAAFQRELESPLGGLVVTPTIGISLFPDDGGSGQEIIEHADTAMCQAKKQCKGGYTFYADHMLSGIRRDLEWESQLRRALHVDQFLLHYQPIMDSERGTLTGVEALLRWSTAHSGLVMPDEFVLLAEQRGLIGEIGEWVLRRACRDATRLNQLANRPIYVSVNVSALQVRQPEFSRLVENTLTESGLAPELLQLEITESVLMDASQQVIRTLHEIRGLGVGLALDDFGTGYSSLSYLRRFPISKLKIDRSFVSDVPGDTDATSIVTTIIALGRSMGLQVTAEGVETDVQSRFLHEHGCQEQQGFHFARPAPFEETLARLPAKPELRVIHQRDA